MAYTRKTEDVYEVVYDYGYGDGLEVLTRCSTMREAKADRKAYIENEHICPMIRKRRYPFITTQSAKERSNQNENQNPPPL